MHKYIVRIEGQLVIDENAYACMTESQAKTIIDWLVGNKVNAQYMIIEKWEELKKECAE